MTSEPKDPRKQDISQAEAAPENSDIMDVAAIVQQLEDLVKISLESEEKELKPGVSFVEVHKKLLQIQKDIKLFQDTYKEHLALLNLTPEEVRPTPEDLEELDPKQRKVYDKIQGLLTTCEEARERLHQSMQVDQQTLKAVKSELKETSKDKEKLRRKGKFKGLGGKAGWMPT